MNACPVQPEEFVAAVTETAARPAALERWCVRLNVGPQHNHPYLRWVGGAACLACKYLRSARMGPCVGRREGTAAHDDHLKRGSHSVSSSSSSHSGASMPVNTVKVLPYLPNPTTSSTISWW